MDFLTTSFFMAAVYAMLGRSVQQELTTNLSSLISQTIPRTLQSEEEPISAAKDSASEVPCYSGLGCFPNSYPWSHVLKPFPPPFDPQTIDTRLYLFTRNQPKGIKVTLWPTVYLERTGFNTDRPTAFITHGFATNTSAKWMHDMKDAYLENMDANVFLVDWGKGAKMINYLQAAANTRMVGAELARFGYYITKLGVKPGKIHAIGHSLGAHISGYFGKRMAANYMKIGRITALDAAQPGFETESETVKLTKNDAVMVDVVHTDARPFIPFFGFGMLQPVGHVDFYVNGGALQPGCYHVEIPKNITSLTDLIKISVEILSRWVSCSHGRAYEYFTWALRNKDCLFVGRKMSSVENIIKVSSSGTLSFSDPLISSVRSCTKYNCNIMGLVSSRIPARGRFAVTTDGSPPFCRTRGEAVKFLKNVFGGLLDIASIFNPWSIIDINSPF